MTTPARAPQQLPERADAQVPVAWEAAKQTYALVGLNYKSVAKLGALPVVVIGGLQTLYSLYPTLINLALSLCGNLLATAIFAIGLNRLVMASQQNQLYRFRLGKKGFKYITLTLMALIPVMLMTMGIFALGFVLARLINAPSFGYIPMLLATLLGLAVASYTAVRFSILLPAMYHDVAIDLHSILRSTRGQAGAIWLGLLLTLSPILVVACLLLVVQIGYGPFPWVANLLQGFTLISAVPLSLMFLAFNCHRYSQVTAPVRLKIIKDPLWQRAAAASNLAAQRGMKAMRLTFYTIALSLAHLNSALGKLGPKPKPVIKKAAASQQSRNTTATTGRPSAPAANKNAPPRASAPRGTAPHPTAAPAKPAPAVKRPMPPAVQPSVVRPAPANMNVAPKPPAAARPANPAPPAAVSSFQQKLQQKTAAKK